MFSLTLRVVDSFDGVRVKGWEKGKKTYPVTTPCFLGG